MDEKIYEVGKRLCSGKNRSDVELAPGLPSKYPIEFDHDHNQNQQEDATVVLSSDGAVREPILSVKSIVWISLASTFALALIVLIATFAGIYGYRLSRYVHCVEGLEVTPTGNLLHFNASSIQTGDLILFSFRLNASLATIPTMVVTRSPITHLGLVIRNPDTQLLYLVEVTLEGLTMRGCGIANLEARVSMYPGIVLWRKLYSTSTKPSKKQELDEKAFQLAQYCVQRNFGYRYSFLLTMWNRIGPPMTPMAVDFDNSVEEDWICTDLVAWILEQLKIFLVAPVTLLPRDFHSITQRLPMNPNYYYGVESRLK